MNGKELKTFKLPDFEDAFSMGDFGLKCNIHLSIGKYNCEIANTNCDVFTVAIGTNEHPVYNKNEAIWWDKFSYRDNEDKLRDWYSKLQDKINEEWEKHIDSEFFENKKVKISDYIKNIIGVILIIVACTILCTEYRDDKSSNKSVDTFANVYEVKVNGEVYKLEKVEQ